MRLIDADLLIKEMSKWYWDKEKQEAAENDVSPMDLFTHLAITTVEEQPIAFDVYKTIDELKRLPKCSFWNHNSDNIDRMKAIEIVKGGVVQC